MNPTLKPVVVPADRLIRTTRPDGRHATTAGVIHARLKKIRPALAFPDKLTRASLETWKAQVRRRLRQVLNLPARIAPPPPRMLSDDPRPGYRLQRWEIYPEPDTVLPVMLLVPEAASPQRPAPAVLCLPGSDHPNAMLAGEPLPPKSPDRFVAENAMARHVVERGMVALCVENPGTAGLFNPLAPDWRRQCMELIWMGSSYEALSTLHKLAALHWLKRHPLVDRRRIAVSGHSLGAKPALHVGLLDPDVKAVIWNSGAYDFRLRHVTTNLAPIAPWQYIPGFVRWFDYPDLMAALAPTPLLISEGGRSDELRRVRRAYTLAGKPRNFTLSYSKSFRAASARALDRHAVPEGLTGPEFAAYHNGTDAEHHFQFDVATPWLERQLG